MAVYDRIMKTVAVIGASPHRHKFGNKAVRAFAEAGYNVVPITPHHPEVEGLAAFATVADYPGTIDMATLYVPPAVGLTLLEGIAKKGIAEVWFNPGADSPEAVRRARALGLNAIEACSIVAVGMSPAAF